MSAHNTEGRGATKGIEEDATSSRPRLVTSLRKIGLLATTAVAGVLVLGLIAGLLGATAARSATGAVSVALAIPGDASLAVLGERSVVYAADGTELAVLHAEVDRYVVDLDDIPDHVRLAVLTAEDRKFYEHPGYDVEGIGRAFVANVQARAIAQGGSTITQQLAKARVGSDQSLERKVTELFYAIALENEFTKDELLEHYLNQVYFGAGAYGVASAAEEFFGVTPQELTVAQAALLAGAIRSPGSLDPRRNPAGAKARRNQVIRDMVAEWHLDEDEARRALESDLGVLPSSERTVHEPYVVEAVKREIFSNRHFGNTRAERIDTLFSGGLEIHTTIDPRLQDAAREVVAQTFPEPTGPTAAVATVDPRDGRVLALYSGADFTEEQFDLAAQGRRQPGSAFKPFVLATALEQGFSPAMTLTGSSPSIFHIPDHRDPWRVSNYGNASFGRLNMREALVRSVNTAFAQLMLVVGADRVADLAERMGIDIEAATSGMIVPAMALGGFTRGVTPLEMAAAYGTFANGGNYVRPHVIDRVVDRRGREVFRADVRPRTAVHPVVSGELVSIMRDVVRRGTGTRARLPGWQVAGKTGTTQRNADAWFVGIVPVMSTAVWMGHPDAQIPMRGVTGGAVPARMWREFMSVALADVEPVEWPQVEGSLGDIASGRMVTVPDLRGLNETEALQRLASSMLTGAIRLVPSEGPAGRVLSQSPRPGSSVRAGSVVTVSVSGLPEPEDLEETEETDEPEVPTESPQPAPEPAPQPAPSPAPPPAPEPTHEPTPEPEPTGEPTAEPAPNPLV